MGTSEKGAMRALIAFFKIAGGVGLFLHQVPLIDADDQSFFYFSGPNSGIAISCASIPSVASINSTATSVASIALTDRRAE